MPERAHYLHTLAQLQRPHHIARARLSAEPYQHIALARRLLQEGLPELDLDDVALVRDDSVERRPLSASDDYPVVLHGDAACQHSDGLDEDEPHERYLCHDRNEE